MSAKYVWEKGGKGLVLPIDTNGGGGEINFITFIIDVLISVSQEGFLGLDAAEWFPVYLHYN